MMTADKGKRIVTTPADVSYDWDDWGDCSRPDLDKWRATCHDTWFSRSKWCPACLERHPEEG